MPFQVQAPSAARLIAAWERARGAAPAQQALVLLAACCPQAPAGALAALPVGARNRLLISAQREMFTPVYDCVADCPCCSCLLEAQLPLDQLSAAARPGPLDKDLGEGELATGGQRIRYRLPTAGDLAALALPPAALGEGAGALLDRCVLAVDGEPARLLGGAALALAEALAEADPDAVLSAQLTCPECGTISDLVLDPVTFLWAEIDEWAWRLLGEVHELASGYGWDEQAILALSPGRRHVYLSLLAADGGRELAGGRR